MPDKYVMTVEIDTQLDTDELEDGCAFVVKKSNGSWGVMKVDAYGKSFRLFTTIIDD